MTTNEWAVEVATRLINSNIQFQFLRTSGGYTRFTAFGKNAVAMYSSFSSLCNLEVKNGEPDLDDRYYALIELVSTEHCELCSVPSGGGEHALCEYAEKFRGEIPNV
jgi:hypothetical protein